MNDSTENLDDLWELSELEQRIATRPTAEDMERLADKYDQLGWDKEADKLRERAAETKQNPHNQESVRLVGSFTPIVLVELLRVLHLTGKTGELLLESANGMTAAVTVSDGVLVDAQAADEPPGMPALRHVLTMPGGRYQFLPGTMRAAFQSLPADSAALLMQLSEEFVEE
ncbi:DUF4388 domain-containing protein [Synoicihabitans lomoniglobus]|uniref:DUF4388 domain-containing protein n=1 Tax=Synoicihabitans lomoniglobus TaxID=2909285 RepID=A0AAF0CNB2_9BACT|nr:DUF4388 domain-containing protein [Opitutaceae bacterium LMO-M01]WED65283.1 DUF4388 domain-containing protein [Opitutaceae bacterium LMO-M01]